MTKRAFLYGLGLTLLAGAMMVACGDVENSSDNIQSSQQETMLKEATAQTGMPNIKNFRERKLLKDILELRDQDGIVTYTYTFAENSGQIRFFCNSIGYGIPYATEYTSPQRLARWSYGNGETGVAIAQADPNGLFAPQAAEGTWVMCSDPGEAGKVRPVYLEPRVIVSPFKIAGSFPQ